MNNIIKTIMPSALFATLVVGCSATGNKAPQFDENSNAASQAGNFIAADNEEYMKGINKIGVLSCNVMFGMTSSASAATSGGFRAGNTRAIGTVSRSDVKVTVSYTAAGLAESSLQEIANEACNNAEQQLASAGFDLVPFSTIKSSPFYAKLNNNGQQSPFEYKGKSGTRYLVFARNGETISDSRYISSSEGFAQSFKSISGDSAEQIKELLINDLKLTGVNINLLIDFASLQSDGHSSFGGFSNKDTAKVDSTIQLAVTGDIRFTPLTKQGCWTEFSTLKCMTKLHHQPVFSSKHSLGSSAAFYSGIEDITSTTDTAINVVSQTLGFLSALSGTSSKVGRDLTRYQVNILPDVYSRESKTLSKNFLEMAAAQAKANN